MCHAFSAEGLCDVPVQCLSCLVPVPVPIPSVRMPVPVPVPVPVPEGVQAAVQRAVNGERSPDKR